MKIVILAEKPNQAKLYAEAFKNFKRKKGFIEVEDSIFPNGAIITWAIGHLVELADAAEYKDEWKKWALETLPIFPEHYKFVISKDKMEQFEIVRKLLKESDEIIIATDSDREGENIAWSIIEKCQVNKPTKRLWINSLEPDVIREGFRNLQEAKKFYPHFIEARTRQISDWLVGINASRLYTILLRNRGIHETFSVGRVQTPTLYMIYERQKEIKNFQPKPFYELFAQIKHQNGSFTAKSKIKVDTKNEMNQELSKFGLSDGQDVSSIIKNVSKQIKKQASPKLFSLSSLQTTANKKWKYSPAEVLKAVQNLYEQKLVTYPRTDTPYITENEYEYLLKNVEDYQDLLNVSFPVAQTIPKKRYVDSSKVQEHYAIIPTKIIDKQKVESLPEKEKNLYFEILRTTLAMFHEDYEYNETTIDVDINNLIFSAKGKVELKKGWKELFPHDGEKQDGNEKEEVLPDVQINDACVSHVYVKQGKTTKPKPYTEGQLIDLMKTCGKLLEDEERNILKEKEGIGTEATRASIIETLKKQHYIEVKKNIVSVTPKGEILCQAVDGTLLSSPSMTAKWESFLNQIGKGAAKKETFLKNIERFIQKLLSEVPEKIQSDFVTQTIEHMKEEEHIGDCPACQKGKIVEKKDFYGCTEYANGCKQTFPKKLLQKNISVTQMKKLLSKGKTDLIKGFKGKKEFDAYITLKDDENGLKKMNFEFSNANKGGEKKKKSTTRH